MRFKIWRTSDNIFCTKPPCEGAIITKSDEYYGNEYEIEINSLKDLIRLSKKHGALIVNGNEIEIYDDYRE